MTCIMQGYQMLVSKTQALPISYLMLVEYLLNSYLPDEACFIAYNERAMTVIT